MFDLKRLTESVQKNCHISDAQYAGQYTLCVFLLKMREYYRWEKAIPQSQPLSREAVGAWLTERESYWDELDSLSFTPLPIGDQHFDPFDCAAINATLNPLGYVYSGGIGVFHKPYFFLGKLEKKTRHNGVTLLVSAREYARDLVAPPAMLLDDTVYIRKECLRRVIWERIEEWRMKHQTDTAMARALACYTEEPAAQLPADGAMEALLDQITDNELEAVLLHEIGEAQARPLLGEQWEDLLDALPPRSVAELMVRAVRDHLADSLSTLPALLEAQNTASLHFYFANLTGLRRELYPEALQAYAAWVDSGSLAPLEQLCQKGQQRWQQLAQQILALYADTPDSKQLTQYIEQLCQPTP
ncbi:MAG TPA: hypothetical protein ENI97_07555 [Gammaproteobacteria bacterium]|nr:hypothetical protein [Gammaproteobacteria bacterium]